MIITQTSIDAVHTIDPERHADERGSFARTWCVDEFGASGLTAAFLQGSISYNTRANTLRGMHFQREPYGETKLIRCEAGAAYDVLLDLRPSSDTYRKWEAFELTPENGRQLHVGPGIAHGFQTLEDETVLSYQIDTLYQQTHASGVRWDDPAFGIEWPAAAERTISAKDRSWPDAVAGR